MTKDQRESILQTSG